MTHNHLHKTLKIFYQEGYDSKGRTQERFRVDETALTPDCDGGNTKL